MFLNKGTDMSDLIMHEIKPKIVNALEADGYKFIQQQSYQKWTKGRNNNVWFSKQIIRATKNIEGAKIVKNIAGVPNGSVSEEQQGKFDCWYTDGYKSYGSAAI